MNHEYKLLSTERTVTAQDILHEQVKAFKKLIFDH
jgi:hypothetical protein